MILIQNVHVYTMNKNNDILDQCDVLVGNKKILQVGINIKVNPNVKVIDGTGCILTPGLIDAHTHVGIFNEGTDSRSDANESSYPFTPALSAIDAINPNHSSFEEARSGGVTTVQTGAGSSNPIGGVWSVVKTSGETVDEMLVRARSGLKGATGENPKNRYGRVSKRDPYTRMSIAKWIRYGFSEAEKMMKKGESDLESLYLRGKEDLEPFIEVLERKMPLRVHAHRADDIVTAIRIAKEYDIDLSIEHATEGYKISSYIYDSGFPVTVGPFMNPSGKHETRDMHGANPKILAEEGIPIAIITDHPISPIQYLSLCAADAVKHGLNSIDALSAITKNAAKILGVDDQVGSIQVNMDADLVLWSHHPFQTNAKVLYTIINGEIVYQNKD